MPLTDELKTELTNYIVRKFQGLRDFSDDPQEISEYIVLLVSNGRTAEETYNEVKDLVSSEGLESIIQNTFEAVAQYEAEQQLLQSQSTEQHQQPIEFQQEQVQTQSTDFSAHTPPARSIPTKPAALASRIGRPNSGGINKRGPNGNNRNSAFRNQEAFQKALNLTNDNGSGQIKKKTRCRNFPNCPNRPCMYAHPTKPCFQFPNCSNAPGTCCYLHPGEDDELIAQLAKNREEYKAQKQEKLINQFVQQNTGIALCKFGSQCSNQKCPFGHPTPANEDAKVTTIEWCPENLSCSNAQCPKAHSSASKVKAFSKAGGAAGQPEKSLDACKFGQSCTNRYCKFRHAKTATLCREGENCTRIDCIFSHPINEDCRFGEGCKNPKCLFKHPNGKASVAPVQNLTWTAKTNERQFAVPEDEVQEHAPPQEAGS